MNTLQKLRASEAAIEESDARMTTEQLAELAESLSILSAKSSVLKERDDLRALMEENMSAEEVNILRFVSETLIVNCVYRIHHSSSASVV